MLKISRVRAHGLFDVSWCGAGLARKRYTSGLSDPGDAEQEVIMTSATMRHHGAAGRHAEGRGLGMVVFAGALVALIGFFNLLDGIAAIAKSSFFIGGAHYVVGDLRAWGAPAPLERRIGREPVTPVRSG